MQTSAPLPANAHDLSEQRAAELLREGVLSVKEVSYAVGFASASGFRAAFHEAHGVTPSAYGHNGHAP